jgi:hypothetical protein
MNGACPCGVALESSGNNNCHDCGTAFCGGCSIVLSSTTYCSWCAASLAPASES